RFGGGARATPTGPPPPTSRRPCTRSTGWPRPRATTSSCAGTRSCSRRSGPTRGGTGPPVTARTLGGAHTSMFDAWEAYDARAVGTRYGGSLRQPTQDRTLENKNEAISFAAYATLVDLFPSRAGDFALQMKELGYAVDGSDTSTPAKIGATTAKAVIEYRHKDGANQLGGYADTTGCQPVNTPDKVYDRWRWQPLRVPLGDPFGKVQKALPPQWATVVPFGMTSQFGHDVPGPPKLPNGEAVFAQAPSRKRHHSLDDDVKLFFALGNALMDAGIAAWAWKFKYDFVRPITGIHEEYRGRQVVS